MSTLSLTRDGQRGSASERSSPRAYIDDKSSLALATRVPMTERGEPVRERAGRPSRAQPGPEGGKSFDVRLVSLPSRGANRFYTGPTDLALTI
jgi:hypothetical protein